MCLRMVAPSLVMTTSPVPVVIILSMPFGPRLVRTASDTAIDQLYIIAMIALPTPHSMPSMRHSKQHHLQRLTLGGVHVGQPDLGGFPLQISCARPSVMLSIGLHTLSENCESDMPFGAGAATAAILTRCIGYVEYRRSWSGQLGSLKSSKRVAL